MRLAGLRFVSPDVLCSDKEEECALAHNHQAMEIVCSRCPRLCERLRSPPGLRASRRLALSTSSRATSSPGVGYAGSETEIEIYSKVAKGSESLLLFPIPTRGQISFAGGALMHARGGGSRIIPQERPSTLSCHPFSNLSCPFR